MKGELGCKFGVGSERLRAGGVGVCSGREMQKLQKGLRATGMEERERKDKNVDGG